MNLFQDLDGPLEMCVIIVRAPVFEINENHDVNVTLVEVLRRAQEPLVAAYSPWGQFPKRKSSLFEPRLATDIACDYSTAAIDSQCARYSLADLVDICSSSRQIGSGVWAFLLRACYTPSTQYVHCDLYRQGAASLSLVSEVPSTLVHQRSARSSVSLPIETRWAMDLTSD